MNKKGFSIPNPGLSKSNKDKSVNISQGNMTHDSIFYVQVSVLLTCISFQKNFSLS